MQVRITRAHTALVFAGITTLTLPAIAGTPAAIDRVPTDAPVVFGINNVRSLLADIDQFNLMLGEDANAEMMMGVMMIRGMEGLNLDGSAAFVVYPDMEDDHANLGEDDDDDHDNGDDEGEDHDEPTMIAIVPVSDFAALTHGREPVNGLVSYPLPEDQTGYFRDIGDGFALFGNDPEAVLGFDGSKGRMKANNTLIGQAGQGIAGDSDIFMYVNLAEMGDEIQQAREGMEEQGQMIGAMGGPQAAQGFGSFLSAFDSIVEDGQAFITGVNFDATAGVAFDVGVQFKPMTKSEGYLHNASANARQYLNHIPSGEYFLAGAMDFSGKGVQHLLSDFMDQAEKQDTQGMLKGLNLLGMAKNAKGGAQVLGASNPMGMTGLLTNLYAYYESNDNDAMIDSLAGIYKSADGIDAEGVSISSSFDEKGTDIAGTTAHAYKVRFATEQQDMGGMMNPQMISQIMFGPNLGPAGYIGEAGGGIIQTHTTDQNAYTRAVQAAQGKNTLGALDLVEQSASHLQDHTVLEFYFGADHTLNTVGPMLMMFGVVPEFEQLAPHAPIAMGFTADGGGATMRTWVPMQVIGSIMELVPEEAMNSINGGGDDDEMDF
ncbi:MAG: hypothetical protein KC996_04920 [Phycisphaerales bacterium]|nr:hypothetical protein [Phycisphaerales bacterium]